MKNNNNNLTPFSLNSLLILKNIEKIYKDPINQRDEIFKDLNSKSGIYCWLNKINNKYYIGSSINLNNRINDYFQDGYKKDNASSIIVRAIVQYGLENFYLIILELTEKDNLLIREQYYIDEFKPKYNILKLAANSLGFKHTKKTKNILSKLAKGRKLSLEVKQRMSENRKGNKDSFFGRKHTELTKSILREFARNRIKDPKTGFVVEVTDILTNTTKTYKSIREAAKSLNTNMITLISREKINHAHPSPLISL